MADAIPAEDLRAALKYIVNEIHESFCETQQEHGIEVSIIDEQIQVSLSVIAPAGGKPILRKTTTTTGAEVTVSQTGEKVSRDEEATSTSSQTAEGYVTIGTVTKTDPEMLTTRTSPFKSSRSVQESTPDTTVNESTESGTQNSEDTGFGSDVVDRDLEYNTP